MVTRVCAQRAGRGKPAAVSDKKRQAESTCGKRVIFSSLAISSGSVAMLCPRQAGRQSKDDAKTKEKIHVAIISAKRNATRISGAVQQREDNSICWEKCAVIAWETLAVSACPLRRSRMAAAVQAADCRLC